MSRMFWSYEHCFSVSYCSVLYIDIIVFDSTYYVILLVWRMVWIFKVRILVVRRNDDLLRTS